MPRLLRALFTPTLPLVKHSVHLSLRRTGTLPSLLRPSQNNPRVLRTHRAGVHVRLPIGRPSITTLVCRSLSDLSRIGVMSRTTEFPPPRPAPLAQTNLKSVRGNSRVERHVLRLEKAIRSHSWLKKRQRAVTRRFFSKDHAERRTMNLRASIGLRFARRDIVPLRPEPAFVLEQDLAVVEPIGHPLDRWKPSVLADERGAADVSRSVHSPLLACATHA